MSITDVINGTSKGKYVIKIGADWCMPCKYISGAIEKHKAFMTDNDISLIHLDLKKDSREIQELPVAVKGIPLMLFYRDGQFQESMTVVGADMFTIKRNLELLSIDDDLFVDNKYGVLMSVEDSKDLKGEDTTQEPPPSQE